MRNFPIIAGTVWYLPEHTFAAYSGRYQTSIADKSFTLYPIIVVADKNRRKGDVSNG